MTRALYTVRRDDMGLKIKTKHNTPIGGKIDKRQIYEYKIRLWDNDGNLLVPTGIVESDSEVEVVFDETANLRISTIKTEMIKVWKHDEEVDIENLTVEQYLMLTQENQTQRIAKTESGRMITKDIKNVIIAEYMEYEAEIKRHPWRYAQSYTRSLGSTTLGRSKVLENKHHIDKLKTNFILLPPCFKPAQPLTKNTHEPLEKDPNDYDQCAPNSYQEDEEVSSDEDVDELLNAEIGKRMTGQDKEEEDDPLIDILKTVVEEYKTIYKNSQIKAPSRRTNEIQGESNSPPNETLHINTYFPDVFQAQLKKPHLKDNSFEEWVKIKLGHTNISETIKCEMFKEWIKGNFNFKVDFGKTRDDPYSRRFDVYKKEFDTKIEQLVNEYELKARRKRYALDEVCAKFHDTTKLWYDKGFEEEELS
nr:leucine--tRNA ligase, chloroplastic/mitochondrial [Tanacetum cinerariifolium]